MLEHTSPILGGLDLLPLWLAENNFERVMGELAIFNTVYIKKSTGFNYRNSFPSKLDNVLWQGGHELS